MMRKSAVLLFIAAGFYASLAAQGQSLPQDPEGALPGHSGRGDLQSLTEYQALAPTSYEGFGGVALVDSPSDDDPLASRLREVVRAFHERQARIVESGQSNAFGPEALVATDRSGQLSLAEKPSSLSERAYCVSTITNLCLLGRFAVAAEFSNPYLGPTLFRAGSYQLTLESGYMWWEAPTVMEVPIKMLNFCGSEGVFKVFAAGLTNFYVRIVILDALTGSAVEIRNPAYQVFNTVIGTVPFPCI